jgi:hypothetical protein
MMDIFISTKDFDEGKVLKYQRANPIGEDIHLLPDGTIERDEDKIIKAQRIFKHNWYKPGGPGHKRALEKYRSCSDQTASTNLESKSK